MLKRSQWVFWMFILGILAYWVSVVVDVYQQKNHVEVSDVSLGVLRSGNKGDFSVTLYNGGREIALRPIRTSCGCLAPDRVAHRSTHHSHNGVKFHVSIPQEYVCYGTNIRADQHCEPAN